MKLTSLIKTCTFLFLISSFFTQCKTSKEDIHKQLKVEVESINSQCPLMVSSTIFLDSCVLLESNNIQYYYTYGDTIAFDSVRFEKDVVLSVKELAKNEPGMATVRDNELTNEYIYRDINGSLLYHFKVTPEDYK